MARKRRRFTAEFKARVALEALQERASVQAIVARHELHPNQVSAWKRQLLDAVPEVFAKRGSRKLAKEHEAKIHDLSHSYTNCRHCHDAFFVFQNRTSSTRSRRLVSPSSTKIPYKPIELESR